MWCWNLNAGYVLLAALDAEAIDNRSGPIYLLDGGSGDLGSLCLDQCRVIKLQVLVVGSDVGGKGPPLTGRSLVGLAFIPSLMGAWEGHQKLVGLEFLGDVMPSRWIVTAAEAGLTTITLAAMTARKPLAARLAAV